MSHNPTRPRVTGRTKPNNIQEMKPAYTIIIIGTGQHHQGHSTGNPERDADNHLKGVVDRLQATGQNITAAAFIVDGKPEMIVGHPEDLRTVVPPEDVTGVTLETVNANVLQVINLLSADKQPNDEKPVPAPKKKKGGAEKPAPVVTEKPKEETQPIEPAPAVTEETAADDAGDEGNTTTETTEKNNEEDAEG